MPVTIAIKSEVDSRVLVYPLLKALQNYGSICLISTNKPVTRLVNGNYEGEFRGIRVIYDADGATDDSLALYGIAQGDYDFFILDNAAAWEYDALFIILGQRQTEEFDYDVVELLEDKRTHLFQFGKAVTKAGSGAPNPKTPKPKTGVAIGDDAESYWRDLIESGGDVNTKVAKSAESNKHVAAWPSYQDIEMVEGQWRFPTSFPSELVTPLHTVLKPYIGVDIQYFMKEVKRADETGGNLKYRNSTRP
jgi:hypothetical protein